jgi:hypothetical protein
MMDKLEDPKTKYDKFSLKTLKYFVFVSFSWKFNFTQSSYGKLYAHVCALKILVMNMSTLETDCLRN